MEFFSGMEEQMIVYGRDEMETLYICPEETAFSQQFLSGSTESPGKGKENKNDVLLYIDPDGKTGFSKRTVSNHTKADLYIRSPTDHRKKQTIEIACRERKRNRKQKHRCRKKN